MKERPILFSAEMVRAIMEGWKTQTRRIVKHQGKGETDEILYFDTTFGCQFGNPGDRLWVRETFSALQPYYGPSDEIPDWINYVYRADFSEDADPEQWGGKWTPSIFMPREASRIILEITGLRVERLHEITYEDAKAEGMETVYIEYPKGKERIVTDPRDNFAQLWENINGPGAWDLNPWVWVIEFKRIQPPLEI